MKVLVSDTVEKKEPVLRLKLVQHGDKYVKVIAVNDNGAFIANIIGIGSVAPGVNDAIDIFSPTYNLGLQVDEGRYVIRRHSGY